MPESTISTMRAVRFHEYGDATTLNVEEIPRPEPGEGQVLVRIRAAGVNPVDWKFRQGILRDFMPITLPHIPGVDFAGTVEAVGPGVTTLARGQEIYGRAAGTYAEYTVASADAVAPKPTTLSFEQAASVVVGASTAWAALFDVAKVEAGQRVLVHGAAGGVGMYAVQFARWKGVTVIATCSTGNVEFVRSLGAETVIDYTSSRFEDSVRGVEAVIDSVGGEITNRSWGVLSPGGILVSVAHGGSEDEARRHGVRTSGVYAQASADRLRQIAELIDAGTVRTQLSQVFPLEQVRRAHETSETGHGRGRIVLHVSD